MNTFFIYSLQTLILQLFFVLVFELFFKKETFFKANRMYLIGALLLSLLIPLLKIPIDANVEQQAFFQLKEIVLTRTVSVENMQIASHNFSLISIFYFVGFFVFSILFIFKLVKLFLMIKNSKSINYSNKKLIYLQNSNQAFSFFNYIFIGANHQNKEVILKHEMVHATQWHSLDILIIELLKIVFWFNPILYHFHKRCIELHEFEADLKSANSDLKKYFEVLLCEILNCNSISLTNNFHNQSLIKKRIVMLQKSKSKKAGIMKYLVVIPVVVVSMMVFSTTIVAQEVKKIEQVVVTSKTQAKAVKKPEIKNVETIESNTVAKIIKTEEIVLQEKEQPLVTVDQVPQFEACTSIDKSQQMQCFEEQLQKHIRMNFTYPEEAMVKNIQGKVYIEYSIDENGVAKVIRTKGPENAELLNAECERIINLLPKFIPAKQKGKNVAVTHNIPITFRLQ